jgi:alpha-glucosidase
MEASPTLTRTASFDKYSTGIGHSQPFYQEEKKSVFRFYPPGALRAETTKYVSFVSYDVDNELVRGISEEENHECLYQPQFSVDGAFSVTIPVPEGTSFYGGGEVPSRLQLNGRKIVLWPTDNPDYDDKTDRAYQAHPFILAVLPSGDSFGVIFDTTFRLTIDLQKSTQLEASTAEGENIPFSAILIQKSHPRDVVKALAEITGKISLPPKWSLGYHQCRWSYYPDSRVRDLAKKFRERDIPCDALWLDIHYMNGYKIFTFDPQTFPNPKELTSDLKLSGFHSVWMIDPGIKKEVGYPLYDEVVKRDLCVKSASGEDYVGSVWPGPCVFPDFTMEETRKWWGGLYEEYLSNGIDGVWNDMNEPAILDSPTMTMPLNNRHRGNGQPQPSAHAPLGLGPAEGGAHAQFHNVYGMLMAKSTFEGVKKIQPTKRPFVLTRSNYLGGQKYAATWTGDNHSSWLHLGLSIPMILNLGISGQPFSGPDIGGFTDNASGEMWSRWLGIGAFLPFSRGHTHEASGDHEPWSFGLEVENTSRIALKRRYAILPYLYTLFHECSVEGTPVARPLFFEDPSDVKLRDEDRAFALGDSLLVVCDVLAEGGSKDAVALPQNSKWYTIDLDGHSASQPNLPTLKIKGGSIIPTQAPMQYVGEKPFDLLTLLVALDENGVATGELYEDEGDGYGYNHGVFLCTTFSAALHANELHLTLTRKGVFTRPPVEIKVRLVVSDGEDKLLENALYDGGNTGLKTLVFPLPA